MPLRFGPTPAVAAASRASVVPCVGLRCTVRDIECRVESWDRLGADGRWLLRLGPLNRWSGEVPGA